MGVARWLGAQYDCLLFQVCTKNRTVLTLQCPSSGLGESSMYRVSNCVDAGMYQFWPREVRYTCTKNRTALMLKRPSSGLGKSGILVRRIELR